MNPEGGKHRDAPCSQMDIDTDGDILPAEIFFVTLYHRRIGFAVNVFCFLQIYKQLPLRLSFFLLTPLGGKP